MTTSFEMIDSDITKNRRFSKKNVYVISTEVHVHKGVRVAIEDGTTILIMNGIKLK